MFSNRRRRFPRRLKATVPSPNFYGGRIPGPDDLRDTGFLKALIEGAGDRILGFTALGPEAGEVMAVVQVAMLAGLPYTALRDAVLTHPTMAEGMAEGLAALFASVPQG